MTPKSPKPPETPLHCPHCGHEMKKVRMAGELTFHSCLSCKGVWLPGGGAVPAIAAERSLPMNFHCPLCGIAHLRDRRFRHGPEVIDVEQCDECGGTWLEQIRLPAWRALIEPRVKAAVQSSSIEPPITYSTGELAEPTGSRGRVYGMLVVSVLVVGFIMRDRLPWIGSDQVVSGDRSARQARSGGAATGGSASNPASATAAKTDDIGVKNSADRSGMYYLPTDYDKGPLPVLVALHGAAASSQSMLNHFRPLAERYGFLLVAPAAVGNGKETWAVGDEETPETEDLIHVMNCVTALGNLPGVKVDRTSTLIVGFSAGGSAAAYIASRESYFTSFAVLHGGVSASGLGSYVSRGWFSTGEADAVRPQDLVKSQMAILEERGFSGLAFNTYPGGHTLSEKEVTDLIEWWLG